MMVWSINLFILSIGIFIVGMIKPGLVLFWMEEAKRIAIAMLSAIIFMIAATMYGEGLRENQKIKAEQAQLINQANDDKAPTVVIEEVLKKQ